MAIIIIFAQIDGGLQSALIESAKCVHMPPIQ